MAKWPKATLSNRKCAFHHLWATLTINSDHPELWSDSTRISDITSGKPISCAQASDQLTSEHEISWHFTKPKVKGNQTSTPRLNTQAIEKTFESSQSFSLSQSIHNSTALTWTPKGRKKKYMKKKSCFFFLSQWTLHFCYWLLHGSEGEGGDVATAPHPHLCIRHPCIRPSPPFGSWQDETEERRSTRRKEVGSSSGKMFLERVVSLFASFYSFLFSLTDHRDREWRFEVNSFLSFVVVYFPLFRLPFPSLLLQACGPAQASTGCRHNDVKHNLQRQSHE